MPPRLEPCSAPKTASRGARRLARLAQFARGRAGSTAVEFSLVAIPFLALIMGVLEISMLYLVSTTLDNATADVARQIRTGQLQTTGGATSATFAAAICNELGWLGSNCGSNLYVDVRTFASFSAMTYASPVTGGAVDTTKLTFNPGTAGQIVLVRAFYQWTLFTPLLDQMAADLSGGSTLITATAAFQNEPYPNSGA